MSDAEPGSTDPEDNVLSVAERQRWLLGVFFSFYILAMASSQIPAELDLVVLVLRLVLWVGMVVVMARLASKLYSLGLTITFSVLTLIPLLNLIAMLIVNQKASALIKDAGFKVGLGGADVNEIKRSLNENDQPSNT